MALDLLKELLPFSFAKIVVPAWRPLLELGD